ncbi:hypothetical protein [Candidatus Marithrix sp. Canyon 246]|uniref:hypothetical protein n=1 Tax=Candidatus Marithrix sp. Canyon 246 TaxID=1827136 RepID=UPI000849EEF7|nr:hypothetical protein [Candidatus Marithrix sp. Canyon 246]
MNITNSDPQTIQVAFAKLRADYQLESAKVATKENLAARQQDKILVKQAAAYTADNIFQVLAKLQANFGQSIDGLTKDMTTEAEKLTQISKAIKVENQRLTSLNHIKIAAEALNILQQQHQQALQSLDKDYLQRNESLELKMTQQRDIWQQQQQQFENSKTKQHGQQDQSRHNEEEEYEYKLKRQHTETSDNYEKQQRDLEHQLAESERLKEKDWTTREQFLEKHQAEFAESQTKVESIPKEIEEASKKAREKAIRDNTKYAETQATLLQTEQASQRKSFELRIASLNQIVAEQKTQIAQLNEQLTAAAQQVQQLAMTAVSSTGV